MKNGWQTKTLGDVCEVIAGQSPEGKFYNSEGNGHPFYQGKKDFGEKFIEAPTTWTTQTTKVAKEGDILMSVRAPVGPVNFSTEEICIGRGLAAIRSGIQLNRDFLFYQLLHLQPEIAGKEGAVFASINKAEIEALPLAFAPLAEQRRIVGLLDEAFAGLATAKANAEKNLPNASALFESHLQSVYTQRGPGWVEKPLGEALVKTETTDPTRSPQTEFDYIDVSSVSKETLAIQETQRLQGKDAPSRARKLVRTNDVIFATIRPTLRRIAIVPDELDSQVCSTGYFVLRAKPDMDHRLVFYFLQTETFMTAMETLQKGASYPAVTDGDVRLQTIPIPPLNEQKTIAAKLESLREETQRLTRLYEQKHVALEALKKSLLHQAFTGEL